MKESVVEKYLREQVELRGGLCEKHTAPGRRGVPDRLVTWLHFMELVETKAPGKKPRPDQVRDHARRAALGVHVPVLDTKAKVDEYVRSRRIMWPRSPK